MRAGGDKHRSPLQILGVFPLPTFDFPDWTFTIHTPITLYYRHPSPLPGSFLPSPSTLACTSSPVKFPPSSQSRASPFDWSRNNSFPKLFSTSSYRIFFTPPRLSSACQFAHQAASSFYADYKISLHTPRFILRSFLPRLPPQWVTPPASSNAINGSWSPI